MATETPLGGVLMGLPMVMGLATRVECVPPCARAHVGLHRRVLYQPLALGGMCWISVRQAVQPDHWGPQQAALEGRVCVAMLPALAHVGWGDEHGSRAPLRACRSVTYPCPVPVQSRAVTVLGGGPPMTHVAKVVIILVYLTLPVNQMALCSSCHVE